MYWYVYNNTVPLLNIAKFEYFIQYIILKNFKFSTILSASQPASMPAVRPGSTSAMAPDFSPEKGNRV